MTDITHPFIAALQPLLDRVDTSHTWVRLPDGQYRHRRDEDLTPVRLAQHLNGGPSRGVCPLRRGASDVAVAVLDFDDHDKTLSWAEMSLCVGRVVDALEMGWGLTPTLWRSGGGRGVHLYLMWENPQDGASVQAFMRGVLAACDLHDGGSGGVAQGRVEIFPKQPKLSADGYGNQFVLPGTRASVPLVIEELSGLLEEQTGGVPGWMVEDWRVMGAWADVPFVEAPVREASLEAADFGLGAPWRPALEALARKPELFNKNRDAWRNVLFALHFESAGGEAGRALAHEWSARLPHYAAFEVDKVWNHATTKEKPITGKSIMVLARKLAGWVEPIDASEFGALVVHEAPRRDASAGGAVDGSPAEIDEEPDFDREKGGAIKPTMGNTVKAVRVSSIAGRRIAWDEFKDEITVAQPGTNDWRPMKDGDRVEIRIALENLGFKTAGAEQVRDAVNLVAERNCFDSAQLWLRGVSAAWDGVRRVDRFLIERFGCADTPYCRAVARYMWTALAGRVLDPGCQVDMVPIFEGDQGIRKSTAIAALVPDPQFFVEVDLGEDEEKIVRKSRGVLVAEIAELSGLQTRQLEWVKKYVTRRTEKWVPKYKEFPSTFKRRVVHFGTTNRDDVLADDTGERRWLPLHVVQADVEGIVRDRDQLWAEGARMWAGELCAETAGVGGVVWGADGCGGVAWRDAERLAVLDDVHAAFTAHDSWESGIAAWLDGNAADDMGDAEAAGRAGARKLHPFAMADLLRGALGMSLAAQDMRAQKRAGSVLRRMGYTNKATRHGGAIRKMWHALQG